MCDTCGCSSEGGAVLRRPGSEGWHVHLHDGNHGHHHHEHDGHGHHNHHDAHDHHGHQHDTREGQRVVMEQDVLLQNNLLAERNRGWFEGRGVLALNLLSSPGSGKTTLLEKTIPWLGDDCPAAVIEGDQQTMRDAERIDALGVPVIQVNTGTGCHLDAAMVGRAAKEMELPCGAVLFIENVGNLVCPALFDLGEAMKIVIISVTEGDDKPLKYPTMFQEADICILNKTDLLPYVAFDVERCKENAMKVNHRLGWFEVSAATGEGMEAWIAWLHQQIRAQKA
ncbi:hydrogenase nickel incorporation protein HypB [Prosthecochloris sp. CIB 2401]|uniref:hydrogenase nickel incorporation protein HypB n=1 Tax=Prosthecochloris sp. CIB 2401 TaxID=1868325 RepID=UPI00080AA438|nr:hydrogenase nickel incorporation protein HypB [Prosthecochloris sp. CIB 2401]ANT65539.1 Hydrogenase isoenzymes nickel incorporation protein HypB [Prosthecochloris sp. CIB 2401]